MCGRYLLAVRAGSLKAVKEGVLSRPGRYGRHTRLDDDVQVQVGKRAVREATRLDGKCVLITNDDPQEAADAGQACKGLRVTERYFRNLKNPAPRNRCSTGWPVASRHTSSSAFRPCSCRASPSGAPTAHGSRSGTCRTRSSDLRSGWLLQQPRPRTAAHVARRHRAGSARPAGHRRPADSGRAMFTALYGLFDGMRGGHGEMGLDGVDGGG